MILTFFIFLWRSMKIVMGNFISSTPYLPSLDSSEVPVESLARLSTPTPIDEGLAEDPISTIAPEPELPFSPLSLPHNEPSPAPVARYERKAPIKQSFPPLSRSQNESGIPIYILSVSDEYVSFFVPASHKVINRHRAEFSLKNTERNTIYHAAWVKYDSMAPVSALSAQTLRKYTDRGSFACADMPAYCELILSGLLLGCRVRDYEQRCATVIQMEDFRLRIPKQGGWLERLKLKTTGGERFEIDVRTVIKDEDDKRWTAVCYEPRRPLPSSVSQGCHLEIIDDDETERWQSAVTGALFAFHSNKKTAATAKPIQNWPLLERIYGAPRCQDFSATSKKERSIRLRNGDVMKLNPQQAAAIDCYNDPSIPAFVIEAPPGSGKTLTAAAMAISYKGKGVQLFLSTANVPVNNMALALAKLDYGDRKPLHLVSAEGEERMADQNKSPFSALSLAENQEALRQRIEQLEKMAIEKGPNEKEQKKKQARDIWEACAPILDEEHDTIFATVDTILKRRVKPNKYGYHNEDIVKMQLETKTERIVIDEASQLPEAALNAIILDFPKAQIVLIGDSKQLSPFKFKYGDVVSALAHRSALEIVQVKGNVPVFKLDEVYRASAPLISHYADVFYEGRLKSGIVSRENPLLGLGNKGTNPRLFWKVKHGYCKQEGTSKFNEREIKALCDIIRKLRESKIDENDVMIISYYDAQRKKVVEGLRKHWEGYEVLTVDSAQGREKRIVIVLTTRTSVPAESGEDFFNSPKRCNVAVSRHQDALIVLGHPSIASAPNWTEVLSTKYFKHVEDISGVRSASA